MNKEKLPVIVKTVFVSTLLFIESLLITNVLWNQIKTSNLLSLDLMFIVTLGLLLLFLAYTYALTIGAWDVWLQYIIVPLPISLGILLVIATISIPYALLIALTVYAFSAYDVFFATRLKNELIRFNPRIILRFSTKSLLFIYALVGGLLVLLGPEIKYDLGSSIATMFSDEVSGMVQNVEIYKQLSTAGVEEPDFRSIIETSVNNFIKPYAHFVAPIIAIITLASVSMVDSVVFLIFSLTIDIVFLLARSFKFIHSEYREVQQEIIRF